MCWLVPSERLLARIELDHVSLFPLTASGSYRISLVQSDTFTYFENNNGDRIAIDPISFSASNSGLITIVPAAVPEPATSGTIRHWWLPIVRAPPRT